jgi:hypothetical protein
LRKDLALILAVARQGHPLKSCARSAARTRDARQDQPLAPFAASIRVRLHENRRAHACDGGHAAPRKSTTPAGTRERDGHVRDAHRAMASRMKDANDAALRQKNSRRRCVPAQ